jgi:hypothetical protein
VFANWGTGGTQGQLGFDASGNFYLYDGSTTVGITSRDFADVSQWSHYHVAYNTGESGTDKVKLTINGVLITNWSTDNRSSANAFQNVGINGEVMIIGNNHQAGSDAISLNGYMAQVVFLDGTASAASNFGQVDTSTGRWIPSDLSSFSFGSGNNTVFLDFADSDALGDDESGQGHDFTNNNTVVQVGDSPTVNFGTLSPVNVSNNGVLSNGNRTNTGTSGGSYSTFKSGLNFTTEKIFVTALVVDGASGADVSTGIGVAPDSLIPNGNTNPVTGTWGYAMIGPSSINIFALAASVGNHSISVADGDRLTMAVDGNTGDIWFGFYDTSAGTHQYLPPTVGGTAGNPALGTLPTIANSAFNGGKNVIYSGGYGTRS